MAKLGHVLHLTLREAGSGAEAHMWVTPALANTSSRLAWLPVGVVWLPSARRAGPPPAGLCCFLQTAASTAQCSEEEPQDPPAYTVALLPGEGRNSGPEPPLPPYFSLVHI